MAVYVRDDAYTPDPDFLAGKRMNDLYAFDKRPLRTLLFCIALGIGFFDGSFLLVHLLTIFARVAPDPSIFNFYPIMTALGAIFGFERWWAYEQGGVNPFHD